MSARLAYSHYTTNRIPRDKTTLQKAMLLVISRRNQCCLEHNIILLSRLHLTGITKFHSRLLHCQNADHNRILKEKLPLGMLALGYGDLICLLFLGILYIFKWRFTGFKMWQPNHPTNWPVRTEFWNVTLWGNNEGDPSP